MSESLAGAIRLPDGTAIRGRGRRDPLPSGPLPDFGLYLQGRSRATPPSKPGWQPGWEAAWIDWPDFRIPRDKQLAAASIIDAFERARSGQRVEVACGGGTGRTGTVIACRLVRRREEPP